MALAAAVAQLLATGFKCATDPLVSCHVDDGWGGDDRLCESMAMHPSTGIAPRRSLCTRGNRFPKFLAGRSEGSLVTIEPNLQINAQITGIGSGQSSARDVVAN
jgi:hypothetical protein